MAHAGPQCLATLLISFSYFVIFVFCVANILNMAAGKK